MNAVNATIRIATLETELKTAREEIRRLRALAGLPPEQGDMFGSTPRPKRNKSAAEHLYAQIQGWRQQQAIATGVPYVPDHWPAQRQNKVLGPLLAISKKEQERFSTAFSLYLDDPEHKGREPAWSLAFFMSSGIRAKYESRAAQEEAA